MSLRPELTCPECDYTTTSDYGWWVHFMREHPDKVVKEPITYDESMKCPECGHHPATSGPFEGGVFHSSGCSLPDLVPCDDSQEVSDGD